MITGNEELALSLEFSPTLPWQVSAASRSTSSGHGVCFAAAEVTAQPPAFLRSCRSGGGRTSSSALLGLTEGEGDFFPSCVSFPSCNLTSSPNFLVPHLVSWCPVFSGADGRHTYLCLPCAALPGPGDGLSALERQACG